MKRPQIKKPLKKERQAGRPPTDAERLAVQKRDPRFDGRFFMAVRTTGIYCRPVCPAQPLLKNIEIFDSSVRAESAGYRPCQRCRPESAPGSAAWMGRSAVVKRALRALADPERFQDREDEFAERFGVSARHLRRLFIDELGQSPRQLMLDQRLNFARKLVRETRLPMAEVAMSAGFGSLTRFNHAFRERFHEAPRKSRIAKEISKYQRDGAFRLQLAYRPPYDWNHALGYFRHHQIPGVEFIDDSSYARAYDDGWFQVECDTQANFLVLKVWTDNAASIFSLAQRVRRMFDLDSDPLWVESHFSKDAVLQKLGKTSPGLRVTRAYDGFEAMIGTVLGQLVSVKFARELMGDLVRDFGTPVSGRSGAFRFPRPQTLVRSRMTGLRSTEKRKQAIREISQLLINQELDLREGSDLSKFKTRILAVPGIGPWSAEYMALRALGDPDAFPGTDLILKRALAKHPSIDTESLSPWRSYLAIHLWHRYARELTHLKKKG